MERVTITDIAKKAEVSIATVSYVLNQTREVSPELKQRVLDAVAQLGYFPDENARNLRNKRSSIIGLIVPDNSNPFFAEIAKGVEDAVFESGYSVILCNSNSIPEREMSYIHLLISRRAAGVIFVTKTPRANQVNLLVEKGIPTSVLYRDAEGLNVDTFQIDNHKAGIIAARHLIELGHTQMACFRPLSDETPSAQRVEGFKQALRERGLAWNAALMPKANYRISGGEAATQALLDSGQPFTAIFTGNDAMAIGAMKVLREAGKRIPQDVSLIGLDDIVLASYTEPPLTTIAQPKQEVGYAAARHLIERIEKAYVGGSRNFLLDVQLVVRGSTAPRAS